MFAEQNKCGNVPAHNENPNRHPNDGKTYRAYMTQILGCEKQCISTKTFHKTTIHHAKHQKPKDQQYLVFPKMQEDKLNG